MEICYMWNSLLKEVVETHSLEHFKLDWAKQYWENIL